MVHSLLNKSLIIGVILRDVVNSSFVLNGLDMMKRIIPGNLLSFLGRYLGFMIISEGKRVLTV
jgi:hypothetical protein